MTTPKRTVVRLQISRSPKRLLDHVPRVSASGVTSHAVKVNPHEALIEEARAARRAARSTVTAAEEWAKSIAEGIARLK